MTLARATWEDVERVTALYRACELDRVGAAEIRPQDLRFRWLGQGGPGQDTLLVTDTASGDLAAYAEFAQDTDPWTDDLDLYIEGRVHPAHTGRGLATFLMGRAEDRARRGMARTGADTAVLRTTVVDGDDRALAWYRRRGWEPVRYFLKMSLDLDAPPPAPVWPEGVTVRTVDRSDLGDVWRTHQAAFADLPTAVAVDFPNWRASRVERDPDLDLSLWFVAESDGTAIGVCLARGSTPEAPAVGDVRDLGVVPAWRRRGVAIALLRTALAAFRDRGLTGAALEVDDVTLDGAAALYGAAGLRIVRRTDVLGLALGEAPATTAAPGQILR